MLFNMSCICTKIFTSLFLILFNGNTMARVIKGMMIKCDPSIKSLVVKIDQDYRDIIIEELDDQHLLIDPSKLAFVKKELNKVLADNTYNPFDDKEK